MDRSISIRPGPGAVLEDCEDRGTIRGYPSLGASRPGFEEAFQKHYSEFRGFLEEHRRPGLLICAVGPRGVEASAAIAARTGSINATIVGRHRSADIHLTADFSLSLRHLAVIVFPHEPGRSTRFRLLDLRTAQALVDETGRCFEALEADGPVFVQAGLHTLFFFPAGPERAWPEDRALAWQQLPGRLYLDAKPRPPEWSAVDEAATEVLLLQGPGLAQLDSAAEVAPLGELSVRSRRGELTIPVSEPALRRGVLLGRYARCEGGGPSVFFDHVISRVHVLLIAIAGGIYLIDAASKNGTFVDGRRVRIAPLEAGLEFALADGAASLSWRYIH